MNQSLKALALVLLLGGFWPPTNSRAIVDEGPDPIFEAANPYIKRGYTLRADTWGGDLPVGEAKPIIHQLFAGNDYIFIAGTATKGAKISVHIYDEGGTLTASEAWQKPEADGCFAVARIKATHTGKYHLLVKIDSSPEERTNWGMIYLYK